MLATVLQIVLRSVRRINVKSSMITDFSESWTTNCSARCSENCDRPVFVTLLSQGRRIDSRDLASPIDPRFEDHCRVAMIRRATREPERIERERMRWKIAILSNHRDCEIRISIIAVRAHLSTPGRDWFSRSKGVTNDQRSTGSHAIRRSQCDL